jgi:hypothetical protein
MGVSMKIGIHQINCERCSMKTSHTVERDPYVGDLYQQCVPCGNLVWIDTNGIPSQDIASLSSESLSGRGWTTGRYTNSSRS